MGKNKIAGMAIIVIFLSGLLMLSSCSKSKLTTPFRVYFYTTNRSLPTLYMVHSGKTLGKLPVLDRDPVTLDTTLMSVMLYDATSEVLGANSKGQVIQTFQYDLSDDGNYKEGGGGYLLFDTWQKEKYTLLIRVNQQF